MTDAEVIAYYRAGTLFRELHRPADTNQQGALHARLAALHNSQSIDLLALAATPEFQGLEPTDVNLKMFDTVGRLAPTGYWMIWLGRRSGHQVAADRHDRHADHSHGGVSLVPKIGSTISISTGTCSGRSRRFGLCRICPALADAGD